MNAIKFSIVASMNTLRGIGKEGGLPWRLSGDMRFFKSLTTTTTVATSGLVSFDRMHKSRMLSSWDERLISRFLTASAR